MQLKINKRMQFLIWIIAAIFAVNSAMCVKRLLFSEETLSTLSGQYTKTLLNAYPRGTIYDINGIPFNNRSDSDLGFFKISSGQGSDVAACVIGETEQISGDTTSKGLFGTTGIQNAYDEYLRGGTPVKVSAYVDAEGAVVENSEYYVSNDHVNEGCDIYTSLDYNLQKSIERILQKEVEEKGYSEATAVLTRVADGNILAMASCGSQMNLAVLSFQPGSIMKIITAAVAFERKTADENTVYDCTGSVKVGDEERSCMNGEVHGKITIAEAFAESCNCCFYDLAQKLTYTDENGATRSYVLDKAKEWGFGEYGAPSKNRFALEYDDYYSFVCSDIFNEMDLFNCAIGQGKIQASPYLINKITAAIAAGGKCAEAHIVNDIKDAAGNSVQFKKAETFDLNLNSDSIALLQNAMKETGISGTASYEDFSFCEGIAGKTGTAENIEGENAHAWFTGYFPANEPRYAVTVLIPHGGGGYRAVALAKEVAEEVYKLGL